MKKAFTKDPALAHALGKAGFNADQLGVHSFRKGGATMVTTGSTSCNRIAVFRRGGWFLGVQGWCGTMIVKIVCYTQNMLLIN